MGPSSQDRVLFRNTPGNLMFQWWILFSPGPACSGGKGEGRRSYSEEKWTRGPGHRKERAKAGLKSLMQRATASCSLSLAPFVSALAFRGAYRLPLLLRPVTCHPDCLSGPVSQVDTRKGCSQSWGEAFNISLCPGGTPAQPPLRGPRC